MPLPFVVGYKDYLGLKLIVRPPVFIPRTESEVYTDTVYVYNARTHL